ncbi:MAG: lamin tail domain-containing protein [Chlorobiaceae bacterium]|nr:lamin tail domain-containing protein [Chlorobiaceae bacterium]
MSPYHLFVLLFLLVTACVADTGDKSFSETLSRQHGRTTPVLNEILFDPLQSSGDELPDQPDFVEIYNPGTTAVDLTGWSIADRPSATGKVNRYFFAPAGGNNLLEPGQYAIIAPEYSGQVSGSRLTTFYTYLQGSPEARIFLVKNYKTFSLNNDGDSVRLLDANGNLVDAASYTPNWHNPANKLTKRISLEKFNPLMVSDTPLSWSSSTDAEFGGTPGKANSIYVPPTRSEEIFNLSPNPFSPNGDGRDDILSISISLPAGSYQLAVSVHDATGKLVRRLASGTPAGPVTRLFWDGRDDSGQPLPAGSYRLTISAAGWSGSRYSDARTVTLAR